MSVKFRDSEVIYDVEVSIPKWRTIVQLSGEVLPTTPSDFDVINEEGIVVDYFEGFNIVYDSGDGYIQFTNDSNIYYDYLITDENNYVININVSKEYKENVFLYQSGQGKQYKEFSLKLFNENGFSLYKIENGKLIETSSEERENYHLEQLKSILDTNKIDKINESKIILEEYLKLHPLKSDCHNGVELSYTVTTEKQSLMTSNYLTYNISKSLGLDTKLTWNASGCECEEWTEEEYTTLILQISKYVKPLVSLQQSYEVAIRNCTTQEELDSIEISYSGL